MKQSCVKLSNRDFCNINLVKVAIQIINSMKLNAYRFWSASNVNVNCVIIKGQRN